MIDLRFLPPYSDYNEMSKVPNALFDILWSQSGLEDPSERPLASAREKAQPSITRRRRLDEEYLQ